MKKRSTKTITTLLLLCFGFLSTNAQKIEFNINTTTYGGSWYQMKKHYFYAVWITNANGTFIKTLNLYLKTGYQTYMLNWKASAGWSNSNNTPYTDAYSGASALKDQHANTHYSEWDCKNKAGVLQPDGNYYLHVEFTENNSTQQSQLRYNKYLFTKGGADNAWTYADANNMKNADLKYFLMVGIDGVTKKEERFSTYPNPSSDFLTITYDGSVEKDIQLKLYDVNGKLVEIDDLNTSSSNQSVLNTSNIPSGMYFLRVTSNSTKSEVHKINILHR